MFEREHAKLLGVAPGRLIWRLVLALCLAIACVGCETKKKAAPKKRIEATREQLQILGLEGIRDPNSRRGQIRLRQLEKQRQEIQKLMDARQEAIRQRRRERAP